MGSSGLMVGRLFGIKNSLKNFSKKSFGKIGLFLIFGIIIWNLNFREDLNNGSQNNFLKIKFIYVEAIDWNALSETYDASGTGMDPMNKEGVNNDLKASVGDPIGGFISTLLYGVLNILAKLVQFAGFLMDATLSQDFFRGLVDNEGVYTGWVIVRDTLNLFFMLLLLFSAFATIFQVEKYHLRKMIVMLVVMALLVNFSFPITRFIIDFSNSAMYFLVDSVSTQSPSANFGRFSEMGKALAAASELGVNTISSIILSIILTFIVLVTLLGFAINLLIRLLAFVILIILSPAGFVFAFFPSTKNIADDWWSALFKYAFMGPIMIFFFYLAILMFDRAGSAASGEEAWVISFVKFFVPTAFLWIGLIASQKFGGSGSAMAMDFAKKTGNNIKSYGQKAAWGTAGMAGKGVDTMTGHRISGGIGGLKAKWDSWGDNYKSKSNTRKTEAAARLGVDGANEKLVREKMKSMKDEGVSNADLTRMETGTNAERMAVALFRAENNRFDADPATAIAQYTNAMNAVRGHAVYENQFLGSARKQNMDLVINENITHSGATTPAAIQNIIRGEFQRLNPDQWKDQNIQRMLHGTTPNRGYIITEGAHVIAGYSTQAQENVTRNMGGQRYAEGSTAGLW